MLQYDRVIFVSVSDTCRGPIAAAIMRKLQSMQGMDIESRGLISLFPEPVNPKAVAVAKSNEIDIGEYQSMQVAASDFNEDTLVLVMTDSLKKKIYDDFTGAVNVYTIKEFVGEVGDVEAPYGGELTDYGANFEELSRLVNKAAERIEEERNKE